MNNIFNFIFKNRNVRIVMINNNIPYFVVADVAEVLGFAHTPHMVRMIPDSEKSVVIYDTLGGPECGYPIFG